MTPKEIQILLILSNGNEAAEFRSALTSQDSCVRIVDAAADGRSALHKLEHSKYDLCLLDEWLPDMEGTELLMRMRANGADLPVIVVTEKASDVPGSKWLEEGAKAVMARETMNREILNVMVHYVMELDGNERLRKHAEQNFQREQTRNLHLLSAISSILISVRSDGIVTHWNSVAEKTFGIFPGEVLNNPFESCRVEWDFERIGQGIKECMSSGRQIKLDDLWYGRPRGGVGLLGFTINPLTLATDGMEEVILLGADVTERRKASEKMRTHALHLEIANSRIKKEKAKDEAILESIGEGLVAADEKGRIILVNRQAEIMFGKKAQDMMGKSLSEAIPVQNERGHKVADKALPSSLAVKTGKKTMVKANYVRIDGTILPLHISVSPVILDKKITGVIGIFTDITQEKELDKVKTEFISTVSHELRTPLTSIREGVAQVYEEILGPVNGDQKEFLEIALEEVDRLAAIINDLLDISKIEAGKITMRKSWINFNEFINEIIFAYRPVIKNKGLELSAVLPDKTVEVFCDPDKLKQVVTNLLTNAHKFTDTGGKITLEVEDRAKDILISVNDTGRGIGRDDIPRLFDKFIQIGRTAGPGIKGTGLGLSICKNLIELHEGEIWVDSVLSRGSSFRFTLPKLKKDKAAMENIDQELEQVGSVKGGTEKAAKESSRLSIIVLQLIRNSSRIKKGAAGGVLKNFLKELNRKFSDGSADAFLNGSDECIVIMPHADKEAAAKLGDQLKERLSTALQNSQTQFKISLGISSYPEDADTSEFLLNKARVRMTAVEDGSERRVNIRKNIERSLTLKGDKGKIFEANSVDISEGGLRLSGNCPFDTGTITEIWLDLPKKYGPFQCKAVVMWQRQGAPGVYMLGLKFIGMSDSARQKIRKFIAAEMGSISRLDNQEYRKSA